MTVSGATPQRSAGVKQDVERMNALERLDDGSRFEFSEDGEAFDVARLEASRFTDPKTVALVRFELVASVASVTLSVMPDGAPGRARSGYFGG